MRGRRRLLRVSMWGHVMIALTAGASPGWCREHIEFTNADEVQRWEPTHDVSSLAHTPEGMRIEIKGGDPYVIGPVRDFPDDQPQWLRIRIRSDRGGTGQVFFFRQAAREEDSVRFTVRAGTWEELRLPMPALGPACRLRLDPPGSGGAAVVAFMRFEPRVILEEPVWPKARPPRPAADSPSVASGEVRLTHARDALGTFEVRVAGEPVAVGHTRPRIGYVLRGEVRWMDLASVASVTTTTADDAIVLEAVARDPDDATWRIRQRFSAARTADAIEVEVSVSTDIDRSVVFLPMFVMLPGAGSFGRAKTQGLFAGLEYLDDEPSSSEADIVGPASRRRVPASHKITFPLMAIQSEDRHVGLIWRKDERLSALFDSPDRTFEGGGHLIGLLFPGSDGTNRVEGNLLPYEGERLAAGRSIVLRATIIGGRGTSVVDAVKQYVRLRRLPEAVGPGMSFQQYARLTARGWLDSKIRVGRRWRHAWWPGIDRFEPEPAADAAIFMEWLAHEVTDRTLSTRLKSAAGAAVAGISPADLNVVGISHVRDPVPALVFGHLVDSVRRARETGRSLLGRFEPDGTIVYRQRDEGPDLGRTHDAPGANGYSATVVVNLLRSAIYCGDSELIDHGMRVLRALDRYLYTVPRGAQTWEIPLHTPDILASAHLANAYLLGYELTGEKPLLEKAIHWAWTGVPFVYLDPPTTQPVGPYATIAVLGATHWKAPVWIGLPVQWCGLVYADALYRLDRHDSSGPWRRLAEGITACGVRMSFPATAPDLVGLLPDAFELRAQQRLPVAINPGTLQANAIRLFRRPAIYDYHVFTASGIIAHAPGAISEPKEQPGHRSFTVRPWGDRPCRVLVVGLDTVPAVRIDATRVSLQTPHDFLKNEGCLILRIEGRARIDILTDP